MDKTLIKTKARDTMLQLDKDYELLQSVLKKLGWRIAKDKISGASEFASQGVIYADFIKNGKAIHIEYGDEDCVFGEIGDLEEAK